MKNKKFLLVLISLLSITAFALNSKRNLSTSNTSWFNGIDPEYELRSTEVFNYQKNSDKSLTAVIYRLENKEAVCYLNSINNSLSCIKK